MTIQKGSVKPELLPRLTKTQRAGLVGAIAVFFVPFFVQFPGLSPEGHRVFSVFLMAIVLWITEAIPLHATAALIILFQILLVSDRAILETPSGFSPPAYSTFYHALAHPVLMLFLGGFFLADGAAKYKLDRNLARVLLRPFGRSPRMIMLGLMLITATLSMFMSNTATTATMMAVMLPVMVGLPEGNRMRAGLALCIPVAANIGGIGTPVGTPPNAIALGALAEAGIHISFVQWMLMAIPGMLVLLLFSWMVLSVLFAGAQEPLALHIEAAFDTSRAAVIFYVTFAVTVLLWLTEPLHGSTSSIVGFLPVVVLLATGIFTKKDFQSVQWQVLWLVAGGIALGVGVSTSGLDRWLLSLVNWTTMSGGRIAFVLCLVALVMGSVISHSATANLLVPIGVSLGQAQGVAISPVMAGVFIAIGASLAMPLPISTPPNAIAYSTGAVRTHHMALTGVIIGWAGLLLFTKVAPWLWSHMGVLAQ